MPGKPTTVDDYLATVSSGRRATLETVRTRIRAIIPGAEECISYGMPAFRLDGQIVAGFQATARGCSYYPFSGRTLATLADELAGWSQTKSALHFQGDAPLSTRLLRKLIAARRAEFPAKAQAKPSRPSAPSTSARRTRRS